MVPLSDQVARVRESLAELKRRLRERFPGRVTELRLFGSRARGQAHAESDVDVLVVLDETDWKERGEILDLATDISLDHGVLLSPTVFDRATYDRWREQRRPLVLEIERDGVAL